MMDLENIIVQEVGWKNSRQQPMPGYRQSHALYVLREI